MKRNAAILPLLSTLRLVGWTDDRFFFRKLVAAKCNVCWFEVCYGVVWDFLGIELGLVVFLLLLAIYYRFGRFVWLRTY